MKNLILLIPLFLIGFKALAVDINQFNIDERKHHQKFDVELLSGKKAKMRAYQGRKIQIFEASLQDVLAGIENFEEKCNNELRKYRKWTAKDYNCPHFNKSLSDSKKVELSTTKFPLEKNQLRKYLVMRNIYNREEFRHVDLVEVLKEKKTVVVKQTMLSNSQTENFLEEKYKKHSVFNMTYGEFRLTEIEKNKVELNYIYYLDTEHWLLNKSISVSEVFDSIAIGLDDLFKGISEHLSASKTKG